MVLGQVSGRCCSRGLAASTTETGPFSPHAQNKGKQGLGEAYWVGRNQHGRVEQKLGRA